MNGSFVVERKPENGGNSTYTDSATLTADFKSGAIHPGDLKPCVSHMRTQQPVYALLAALCSVRQFCLTCPAFSL